MIIDQSFRDRLGATFGPLRTVPGKFPASASLAEALRKEADRKRPSTVRPQLAANLGTAAVDIWHRSVHSFLISTALTAASPVWASVSGYYSSHYSVRGIAHLLGYFYLFTRRRVARLEIGSRGGYSFSFSKKPAGIQASGEHQLYWVLVKRDPVFQGDPLFTENRQDIDESDSAHRNYANYIDHLCKYPVFNPLDQEPIQLRIDKISKIVFDDAPIPRRSKFPDVEYVQLVAYHRLVCFRKALDEVLGDGNRFWKVHRNPSFAANYINYQLAESSGLGQYT
jgi:hypothetical protein